MTTIESTRGVSQYRKITALFVLISFTLLNIPYQAYAESLPGSLSSRHGVSQANPLEILDSLSLPEELGTIREKFVPPPPISSPAERGRIKEEVPLVIYIQDAHTNYDSESNIQKLIHLFQEKYGLPLVLLEGGDGRLDSLFFKSFPGEELKKKVLNDYLQKGELSGGEVASILNEQYDTDYYGIETQALYNENKHSFLEAIQKEKEISNLLNQIESELEAKAATLSSSAKAFHEQEKTFHKESIDLIQYLKMLMALYSGKGKGPSFQTAFPELQKVLTVEANEKHFKGEEFDRAMSGLIEEFLRNAFRRLPKPKQMEIGQMIQAFRTGQLTSGILVQKIQELSRGISIPIEIPPVLAPTAKQARTISSIQGTRLFKELEALEQDLRNRLPESEKERTLLKDLSHLELLKRLARLELTHEDWEKLKANSIEPIADSKSLNAQRYPLNAMLSAHYQFYELASKRDEALFQNMNRLMEKKKAKVTVIVTGGFHSEGITQKLRDSNTPFVLISPRINQIGDKTYYSNVMQGKASYMRYFKGSLWNALAQDYTAKLGASLNERELTSSLKRWRDRIIQNAIAEGKITEASSYTQYVDVLAQSFRKKNFASEGRGGLDSFLSAEFDQLKFVVDQKLEIFSAGLKEMWKSGNITPQSVQHLLNQMNTAPRSNLAVALALINDRPEPYPGRVSQILQAIKSRPRSEVRGRKREEINFVSEEEGKEAIRVYAEAKLEGRDLEEPRKNLKPFTITVPNGGAVSFPAVNRERPSIQRLPAGKKIKIIPKEEGREVYLEIQIPGEENRYLRFVDKPNYLRGRGVLSMSQHLGFNAPS